MAHKLRCPNCGLMLKEEGDEMKESQGEYRVYESLWNSKHDDGAHRGVLCLACYTFTPIEALNKGDE